MTISAASVVFCLQVDIFMVHTNWNKSERFVVALFNRNELKENCCVLISQCKRYENFTTFKCLISELEWNDL